MAKIEDFFKDTEETKKKKQELMCLVSSIGGQDIGEEYCCPICLSLVHEPMTCSTC